MYKNIKNAFTLVELIVVITIIAILWTIWFLSIQWYSKSARDTTRVTDIHNIKITLEFFELNTWKYPDPENLLPVTYNWAEIRSQWIFWKQTLTNVWKLNKLPIDPLFEIEYTYSVLNTKKEYELWAIMESSNDYSTLFNTLNADSGYFNYIKWTYNWKLARVSTWSIMYVLAVPSIINWELWWIHDIYQLLNNNKLSHNSNKILPWGYSWIIDYLDTSWNLVNSWSLVVYSWSLENLKDLDNSNSRIILLKWLQDAYSWTILENEEWIKEIINLWLIDIDNPTDLQENLACLNSNLLPWVELPIEPVVYSWWSWWWNWDWWWEEPIVMVCEDMIQDEVDTLNTTFTQTYTKEEWCALTVFEPLFLWLTSLPSEIWYLTNLTELWLWWNSLNNLPSELWTLTNLTNLRLWSNGLESISPDIWNLVNLQELRLSRNSLTSLPPEIWNLTNLTYLKLNSNQLTGIPTTIWNLIWLEELLIWSNQLTYLPSEISNLWNLTSLTLCSSSLWDLATYNHMSILSPVTGPYGPGWTEIIIEWNGTTIDITTTNWCPAWFTWLACDIVIITWSCPAWFTWGDCDIPTNCLAQPSYLNTTYIEWDAKEVDQAWQKNNVDLWCYYECTDNYMWDDCSIYNSCAAMTDEQINNLNIDLWLSYSKDEWCSLNYLNLTNKNLINLPPELWNIVSLTNLNLSVNQLTTIPSEIWNLVLLEKLGLSNNQLTTIPSEIWNLVLLEELYLNTNQLTTIPSEIWNLSNIDSLWVYSNQLTSLPTEIWNLTKLPELDLYGNQLTSLPAWIWNLSSLTYLRLKDSQLINLPTEIWNLNSLETLILDGNQLTSLPWSIWNLSSLTNLWLSINQLTDLPDEIWNLNNLEDLLIDTNQLTSLPAWIWNLNSLETLILNNNQLTSLPWSIWNLSSLTYLGLINNQLINLPTEIWNLSNLELLLLNDNQLSILPLELKNLWKLSWLDLSDNTSIWNLSINIYNYDTTLYTQTDITPDWKTMSIQWNWTTIDITVSD